ncbi:DUF3135 domain-containing protein [Motiliproteus sediminis]|uniref:DUF3135 domain-containing protein n=1 Tax=Motiliproteus sediminis TaxID=1468178 RepID=UPI001AEF9A82|nr:DUF3135 domain-containing protein [Motiliproteus sediminis]
MGQLPCFDDLKKLAETDPQAFDAYRKTLCHEFIDSIPKGHRQRLRAVQFRVDNVIHRAKTPMAGLIKVSEMMHDSLYSLSTKLYELSETPGAPELNHTQAPVIDMRRWAANRRSRKNH